MPGKPPRNLLMIAAAFPPTGGPGVQRAAKFAKYLPQFGWRPVVWTLEQAEGLPRDSTLLNELPPEVIRLGPGAGGSWRRLGPCPLRDTGGRSSLTARLAGVFSWRAGAWLAKDVPPDDFANWALASVMALPQLVRAHGIDAIYSTFSPPSNHWLALQLKEKTGLPWVADFRDLWTDDCRYRESHPTVRREHERLQRRILEAADVVVGVSPSQTRILAEHVLADSPLPLTEKFVTITNGFDPEDFNDASPSSATRPGPFVLAHVGRMDKWRTSPGLLDGLRRFVNELGAERDGFGLRLVGHVASETLDRIRATGVPYTFQAYVPHRDAVREMRAADALLLPLPDGRNADSVIAAKLFEYLAARRPILVVGPKGGECERIVHDCRAGVAVPSVGPVVAEAILKVFRAWQQGRPMSGCGTAKLETFSRTALTQQLAALLNRLLEKERPRIPEASVPSTLRAARSAHSARPVGGVAVREPILVGARR
jgi:glycosyltransferase involved in cell wall biosynthesis